MLSVHPVSTTGALPAETPSVVLNGSRARPSAVSAMSDSTATQGSSAASAAGTITASDFLTLLVTELKNQDPTANQDPNAYIDQLVQVNSLQQLISINQTLSSGAAATTSTPPSSQPTNSIDSTKSPAPPSALLQGS